MKYLMLALLVLVVGCDEDIERKEAKLVTRINGWGSVLTIEHDGHKFVVFKDNQHVAMLLHPDDGKAEKTDEKSLSK